MASLRRQWLWLGLLGVLGLGLIACAQTVSIGRLLADPGHWNNKTVHIAGTVQNSSGAFGEGIYSVDDGTGTVWVFGGHGVPGRGVRVDVLGSVFQGAQFLGRSYGVAIREQRHRSHS